MWMATTVYKPVHETTKIAKCEEVTIRGSYLMHADKHTKLNTIEKLGLYIQKYKVVIKGKL